MKKVVLASLLTCVAIASGLPSAYAQAPVALGTAAAGAAAPCALPDAEYQAYTNAMAQTDPKAKAAAIEAYLTAFNPSACPNNKPDTLGVLMLTYAAANDIPKTLDAADRVLQLTPNDLRALTYETAFRKGAAGNLTDPTAKQAGLDAAAGFAQRGLVAPKPADTTEAAFKTLQDAAYPIFYSAIGTAALNKKDTATAIDAFKKELTSVPLAQTQVIGPVLQDTYYLGTAYFQSTPPDLLNCAFYAARFVMLAPEPYKTQYAPTAKYCYTHFHGTADGYDTFSAAAQANLNPPDGLFASVKPAPTPAEQIHTIITTTADLGSLATSDKEMVFQYGSPEDAAKVWDSVKGKSSEFPNVLVIASTPTQVQAAVDQGAVQSKTADFTFNLAPPEEIPEPKAGATPAAKAAYKKKMAEAQKTADAVAAAIKPGATVTLDGTYDSFTPNPIMITMSNSSVVLPEAAKPAPKAAPKAAPHRAAATH